jgi:hypothetical protein
MTSTHLANNDIFDALPIDAFGSEPGWASRIAGLGGEAPAPDPSYVFRTLPVRPAIGPVVFQVIFQRLTVTHGTLLVELKALSAFPGAEPSSLETVSIPLSELISTGGLIEVAVIARRNTLYVVEGSINDATDVRCAGISVLVDRRATPDEHGRPWNERKSESRRVGRIENAMIASWMTKLDLPSFEEPTSQVWTPRQSRSPSFREKLDELHLGDLAEEEAWRQAFVVQALEAYGALDGHSSGIGLGADKSPIPSALAARGCQILAAQHVNPGDVASDPGLMLEELHNPKICDPVIFFDHVHFTSCNLNAIPEGFANKFDFLWSVNANRFLTAEAFQYFVLSCMMCLRSEGIAVHVFDFIEQPRRGMESAIDRGSVERIVVNALSHLNDVSHLKFRFGRRDKSSDNVRPFGLIVRRGRV